MDKTQFIAQTSVDEKWNVTVEMFFKEGTGDLQSVFGSDRKYWSQQMKTVLSLVGVAGFLYQLLPLKTKTPLPIPAVDFANAAQSLKKIFSNPINIYVMPDTFFVAKLWEIFQKNQTKAHHHIRMKVAARRTAYELLAATTQLCRFLGDARLQNFS